ncbi:MAG: cytochrome d ubiquinol oxidase subunit II [Candidatus Cryptobacteroides sp.]|nr:cytochrome d ubiquinol oxidase subunit II [Candidatus Cryptobacteroides sp.]
MTLEFLQSYWWILVALMAGLLVFLMFVQGANVALLDGKYDQARKRMIINSTGRKWELTFTTLVTFGGAFFASFPLFYSTSFGGAYWVWMLILLTFVFQAVSYEFQNKKNNLLGSRAFQIFLVINGILAPLLIGAAVGTFFTGSDFTVNKEAISNIGEPMERIISSWGNSWHGLETVVNLHAMLLGLSVVSLTMILGNLYMLNNIEDEMVEKEARKTIFACTIPFLAFFLTWLVILLVRPGFAVDMEGNIFMEKSKYLHNFLQMPVALVMFIVGVAGVLAGIGAGMFSKSRKGIWPAGIGTVLVVMALFFIAGFNNTAYYPSGTDLQSSLTIANSSSSAFTLKVMFFVSLFMPFVLAYIMYAWHAMDKKHITKDEIEETPEKY